jgi:hypothetical protein
MRLRCNPLFVVLAQDGDKTQSLRQSGTTKAEYVFTCLECCDYRTERSAKRTNGQQVNLPMRAFVLLAGIANED